jgi:hypothetical protein
VASAPPAAAGFAASGFGLTESDSGAAMQIPPEFLLSDFFVRPKKAPRTFPLGREPVNLWRSARKVAKRFALAE